MFSANSNQSGGAIDATTDPYFNYTTLLLSGDGTNGAQNNTFVDSSVNTATITRTGTPTQGSFSPFSQTGWSGYFDGTGSYLSTPSSVSTSAGWNLMSPSATGTFEAWVYRTSSDIRLLASCIDFGASYTGWHILMTTTGTFMVDGYTSGNNSAPTITSTGSAPLNTWTHVAVTCINGAITFYINGTASGTGTMAATWQVSTSTATPTWIGNAYTAWNAMFIGYLSNVRMVKGVAVYTGNFTPPTTPLTATQSSGTNIAAITGTSTSLLTLQDNRFKDNSTNNFTITAVGTPSVQAFSPLAPTAAYSLPASAAGSAYFNGTSNYLTLPFNQTPLALGSSDFTFEAWVYRISNTATATIFCSQSDLATGSGSAYVFYVSASATSDVYMGSYGNGITSPNPSLDNWSHVAWVRTGGVYSSYLNGTRVGTRADFSTTAINNGTTTYAPSIGAFSNGSSFFKGYISNIRLIKGSGGYNANNISISIPSAPLTAITNTSLLTLQDSTFKDNSVNVATITATSPAPVIQSVTPFTQVWGGLFSSNYLSIPSTSAFGIGTENFTVEAWVYPFSWPAAGNYSAILQISGTGIWFGLNSAGFGLRQGNVGNIISYATNPTINVWTHVAVVRVGTVCTLYYNGVSVATATNSASFAAGIAYIAADESFGSYFTGYISNTRLVKGTAVYTGAFTPPAKTLSATQAAGVNISAITGTATSLLTLQDPTFKDNAILPNTITATGTPKAQLLSAPFTSAATVDPVSGSGYFNGSSYLDCGYSPQFDFGTGDFTVECWVYTTSYATAQGLFESRVQAAVVEANRLIISILVTSGYPQLYNASNDVAVISTIAIPLNTWTHVAFTRNSGTARVFVNGQVGATNASFTTNFLVNKLVIGAWIQVSGGGVYNRNFINGYLSNFRIVKGTAVYTTAFTPPSAPLTAITNTSLLTLQDTTFIDNSANALAITATGTPSMRAFTPFTQAWSGYFDGSSYLTAPAGQVNIQPGSGNFTIEFWYNSPTTPAAYIGLFSYGTTGNTLRLFLHTTNSIKVYTGGTLDITANNAHVANQWNHVSVVRTGTTLTLYVNGVSVGTATEAVTYVGDLVIGSEGGQNVTGYISNFRVVKGVAVYTAAFTPPVKTLSATQAASTNISAIYPGQTSLLTLQDPTFKDNAILPNTITATGSPKAQLISSLPFTSSETVDPVSGSAYFDGSSYVSVPDNVAFTMGAGDFTLECWVNLTTISGSQMLIGTCDSGGSQGSMSFVLNVNSGTPRIGVGYGGTMYFATAASAITANTWVHIAGVRNGASVYIYVNGVQSTALNMGSLAITDSTQIVAIGRNGAGNFEYLTGYISNARIVKGIAVYTGAFTPPSAPLTAITNTSLLTLQNNTFIDNSANALAITTAGTPAMRAFTPFASNWGGYFASGEMLSIASSSATTFATGDFTIEFWLNAVAWTGDYNRLARIGDIQIGVYSYTGQYLSYYNGTGFVIGSGVLPAANKWHHIAVCRSSGTSKLYLNGIQVGSSFVDNANFGAGSIDINNNTPYPTQAYISNFRVVKGTAVYTANFTPPSAPLTAITNTSLLTLQNNTFIDNSGNNLAITATGSPKTQLLDLPFTSSITKVAAPWSIYSVTKVAAPWNISVTAPLATVGGSMYFTGSPDYLTAPSNTAFQFGTGEFTVECWVNKPAAQNSTIVDTRASQTAVPWGFFIDASNFPYFYDGTVYTSTVAIVNNSWNHITVVRTSGVLKIFVNGVQGYSASNAVSLNATGTANIGGTAAYFIGYISNLRIVKGTAIYTAAFTPPTAPPQPNQTPGLLGTNVNAVDGTNTSLLLLGSNAGIYDATAKNDLVTVGNAQVSSTQIKYGTGAMYFDGAGDYLTMPASPNFSLNSAFTFEAWLYPTSFSGMTYRGIWSNTNTINSTGLHVGSNASGNIFIYSNSSFVVTSSNAMSLNTWNHVAVVRNSGVVYIYINGVVSTNSWNTTTAFTNAQCVIGTNPGPGTEYYVGYIDDLRITKYARYTAAFTPPTKAMIGQ